MFVLVTVRSKDQKLLKKLFNSFKLYNPFLLKFKVMSKRRGKKFLSVLRSPHVNKTAQEQFEYRIYSYTWSIQVLNIYHFLVFFKKLSTNVFLDVSFKITTEPNSKTQRLVSLLPLFKIVNTKIVSLLKKYNKQGEIFIYQSKDC